MIQNRIKGTRMLIGTAKLMAMPLWFLISS